MWRAATPTSCRCCRCCRSRRCRCGSRCTARSAATRASARCGTSWRRPCRRPWPERSPYTGTAPPPFERQPFMLTVHHLNNSRAQRVLW
ncbi:MAG: hypothetical protein ACT6T0_16885, partial [Nevskia sp.]